MLLQSPKLLYNPHIIPYIIPIYSLWNILSYIPLFATENQKAKLTESSKKDSTKILNPQPLNPKPSTPKP